MKQEYITAELEEMVNFTMFEILENRVDLDEWFMRADADEICGYRDEWEA